MRTISVKRDQSLADIAIQEYGHLDGIFWLVEDNTNLIGITDNVFQDDLLFIRDAVINLQMRNYLRPFDIATVKGARGEGIGYWAIGVDFIVSGDSMHAFGSSFNNSFN